MRCSVCGQDYGVTHNCPGVAPHITPEEAAPPPEGIAPLYYLRLAFKIVRWDDMAIRRASRDAKAGLYGAFFWTVAAMVILLFTTLRKLRTMHPCEFVSPVGMAVVLVFGLVLMGIITF